METTSRIRREATDGPLIVSRVYTSPFQKKGTLTAELKQTVTVKSFYPSAQVSNSIQDNPFSASEFGFQEQEFDSKDTRVAWIDVPLGSNVETVKQKLEGIKDARLYRVLSNRPIISDNQQYAIDNPELDVSLDSIANEQVVRYPEGHEDAGKLILDRNGKVQYRRNALSVRGFEDKDMRTPEPSDFYVTPELHAEINGSVHIEESQQV